MDYSEHTILLIDDDSLFRKYMRNNIIKHLKCQVLEKENPKDAFEYLKQYKPSLIILDMEMPIMDGYTFLKLLRKTNSLKSLPVIACSALRSKNLILNLLKLKISDFIEKRAEPKIIITKIKKVLDTVYTQ